MDYGLTTLTADGRPLKYAWVHDCMIAWMKNAWGMESRTVMMIKIVTMVKIVMINRRDM